MSAPTTFPHPPIPLPSRAEREARARAELDRYNRFMATAGLPEQMVVWDALTPAVQLLIQAMIGSDVVRQRRADARHRLLEEARRN